MDHKFKTLAIRFSRNMARETRYFDYIPGMSNIIREFDTPLEQMGADSLGWLETTLDNIHAEYPSVPEMPCNFRNAQGDWTLYTLCED